MLPKETIRKRRDGETLTHDELKHFFCGYLSGEVTDYQMSAFLMASYFAPVRLVEAIELTDIFLSSGTKLDLSSIPGAKVDKHSTGGVGDKTSLLVAPIVAAAGVHVPMISGRALGHTGGTLDKLESIPGFNVHPDSEHFLHVLRETGIAMAGQSADVVPLDEKVYALRDVTATVEILPFIAASIMSKKIAGGADALVLDVKSGSGAFMRSEDEAMQLAELLVETGAHFGLPTSALISDMEQPLGRAIGTWLEVVEACDCLQGNASPDLLEVTHAIAGMMIHAGSKAASIDEGKRISQEMIRQGHAWERFLAFVAAQGGDTQVIVNTMLYRNPRSMIDVHATRDGTVQAVNARELGLLAIELGAGRNLMTDTIDPTAGIILMKKRGETVERDDILCRLCSSSIEGLHRLRDRAMMAFRIGDAPVESRSPILRFVHARIDEEMTQNTEPVMKHDERLS